jgi:hypothetical protein
MERSCIKIGEDMAENSKELQAYRTESKRKMNRFEMGF